MSNLENFNNIYADLAESAYTGNRPNNFPPKSNKDTSQYFNFSKSKTTNIGTKEKPVYQTTQGGEKLPNNGIVYLQPDPTVHTVDVKTSLSIPNPNGGYHTESYTTSTYQKGLLTDEKAGFNAYFLTDTSTVNQETKKAYLAIRGSDAISVENLNDWVYNDGNFALNNAHIPQAKLATTAMKEKIAELSAQAPNVKLNITGHSLGTMVSAQGAAQLIKDDPSAINRLGNIVLFDGPDVTQSLKNMGLSDQQIRALGDKTTYYVNPLDIVSMLNRTAPLKEQFGHVNIIVPLNFTTTFDKSSAHDFGEFQMGANGFPLVASASFHPEMLVAGHNLASLIDTTLSKLKGLVAVSVPTTLLLTALSGGVTGLMALGMTAAQAKEIYDEFDNSYKEIVKKAKKEAKKWDEQAIPKLQSQIQSASSSQKVVLRAELLQTVAQDAVLSAEDYVTKIKSTLSTSKEKVQNSISTGRESAFNIAHYLEFYEIEMLLSDFQMNNFWDESLEDDTNRAASKFQMNLEQFSETLMSISQKIQETDKEGAAGFNDMLAKVQTNWGK
ncbi:lipase family protein [Lactococcus allomyrinae]|uniref:DUF2974 domain-containing protein n=1 Tax=Lactococcus allomyrinae TaxID=2419773 RepID=A0A387BDJ9_9LACT|nr:DUF2974 domain-containing protein [Lactococcus allomyrinae]AYG00334.1 DUF2974 domain-containing protein [Lactococcus allomyrinae]